MPTHRVVICTLGYGGWYPNGVSRMIEAFYKVSPGYEIRAFVNTLPPGAPYPVIENGYDYTAYSAKPWVLKEAQESGATVAVLLDAAFYPIRSIGPLIDYIAQHKYYFCKNGFKVGEWSTDRCLEYMQVDREQAMEMEEVSSYCVGLNFTDTRCKDLLDDWCNHTKDGVTFPGPHSNIHAADKKHSYRNPGFCSNDPRVQGHRHDQTVLSILADEFGMNKFVERPKFTTYEGLQTKETVLVNKGGL